MRFVMPWAFLWPAFIILWCVLALASLPGDLSLKPFARGKKKFRNRFLFISLIAIVPLGFIFWYSLRSELTWLTEFFSFALGVFASLLAWWLLFHGITPNIAFSQYLVVSDSAFTPGKEHVRLRMTNIGHRDIIDLEAAAEWAVKGIISTRPNNFIIVQISSGSDRIHRLRAGHNTNTGDPGRYIMSLYLSKMDVSSIPKSVRHMLEEKIKNENVSIYDLFAIGKESHIRIYLYGSDPVSGTRKLFTTRYYEIDIDRMFGDEYRTMT